METLIVLAVLIVVILAPLLILAWYQRRSRGRRIQATGPTAAPTIGWNEILAGDRIVWDDRDYTIQAVIDCREEREHRVFGWRWLLLEDGGLIEYRAKRLAVFSPATLLGTDSVEYEELTNPRGVLAHFERRSRLSWDPVLFRWTDQQYEVTGTGTFYAWSDQDLSAEPVWQAVSRTPEENVYFALDRAGSAEAEPTSDGDGMILGIWTDRVGLYACVKLGSTTEVRISRSGPDGQAKYPLDK